MPKKKQQTPEADPGATGSVQQAALAEALRKVVPFTAGEKEHRENLRHVWAEAHGGTLALTVTDGYRMAHATLEAAWPHGEWLLDIEGCKQLVNTYAPGDVAVEVHDGRIVVGGVAVPVVDTRWVDYRHHYQECQDGMTTMLVAARSVLNKALRGQAGTVAGLKVSGGACTLYLAKQDRRDYSLETVATSTLSAQMATGEARAAFDLDRLLEAARHCGDAVTVKLQDETRPALIEGEGYWQILMPVTPFPSEVTLSKTDREALEWVEEMLRSVRRGDVRAEVRLGQGRLSVSWEPQPERTVITLQEVADAPPAA